MWSTKESLLAAAEEKVKLHQQEEIISVVQKERQSRAKRQPNPESKLKKSIEKLEILNLQVLNCISWR